MHKTPSRMQSITTIFFVDFFDPTGSSLLRIKRKVLQYLSERYFLKSVMTINGCTIKDRYVELQQLDVARYFENCLIRLDTDPNSFEVKMICDLLKNTDIEKVAVIADRTVEYGALHWGKVNGALTVWWRRSRFDDELPPADRKPDFEIFDLEELERIFIKSPRVCRR